MKTEPTLAEINKAIGEYMGLEILIMDGIAQYWDGPENSSLGDYTPIEYTESLDSLIAPIRKRELKIDALDFVEVSSVHEALNTLSHCPLIDIVKCGEHRDIKRYFGVGKTESEAVARALYKALQDKR